MLSRREVVGGGARATLAVAGVLAVACAPTAAPPAEPAAEPVTVSYWTDWSGGTRGDWLSKAMPLFEQEHPKIKTTVVNTSGLAIQAAIVANAAAGTLSDLLLGWNALLPYLTQKKVVLDIAPYVKASKFDFQELVVLPSAITYGGVTYGMPFQMTVELWVYNKTLFQQAGVPAPTEAWTWNDVIEAGRRLTDEGANRWGVGNILPHWSRWSWVVAENDGKLISDDGKHSLLTTPPVVEAVQLQVDLIHRHRVAPLPTFTGSFARGNYATTYSGVPKANVVAVGSQFEWDVMYVPKWPRTGKRVLRIDDQANWMTAQGKQRGHGDQAYELLRWMSAGEPAQRLVAELGPCYPVLKKVAQQPPYGAPPPASIAILAEHTQKWPAGDPVFLYSELWYRAVTAALTPAYTGERSVPEALDAANRAGDGILAQGYEGVK